jgi:flagellar M-ring protein FliF
MNVLSDMTTKLQSLLADMNAQSRILAGLMLTAIVIGAGFLATGYATRSPATESLFERQITSEELDRFESVFSESNLQGYQRGANGIQVPVGSRESYVKALMNAHALPSRLGTEMDEFAKGGNVWEPSRATEIRYRNLRIKSLQNALTHLPFVRDALVTYDERTEGFAAERKKTASVAIYPRGHAELTDQQKQDIIGYIKSAFSGLRKSDIALLDMSRMETTYGDDEPKSPVQDQHLKLKSVHEQLLKRKVLELLHAYGDVEVGVNVQLDRYHHRGFMSLDQASVDSHPTSTDSQQVDRQTSASLRPTSKAPQAYSVGRTASPPTDQPRLARIQNIDRVEAKHVVHRTDSLSAEQAAGPENTPAVLRPIAAGLSVSIPFSYYHKAYLHSWQLRNPGMSTDPAPPPQESELQEIKLETQKTIRAKLLPLLDPLFAGDDPNARVTVTDYIDHPQPIVPPLTSSDIALDWLSRSWKTLALLGLASAALVSLRSFVRAPIQVPSRASPSQVEPFDPAPAALDATGDLWEDQEESAEARDSLKVFASDEQTASSKAQRAASASESQPTLREPSVGPSPRPAPIAEVQSELKLLVQNNPQAAAELMHSWLELPVSTDRSTGR